MRIKSVKVPKQRITDETKDRDKVYRENTSERGGTHVICLDVINKAARGWALYNTRCWEIENEGAVCC